MKLEYTGDSSDLSVAFGLPLTDDDDTNEIVLGLYILAHASEVHPTCLAWARKHRRDVHRFDDDESEVAFADELVRRLSNEGARAIPFMADNLARCWT